MCCGKCVMYETYFILLDLKVLNGGGRQKFTEGLTGIHAVVGAAGGYPKTYLTDDSKIHDSRLGVLLRSIGDVKRRSDTYICLTAAVVFVREAGPSHSHLHLHRHLTFTLFSIYDPPPPSPPPPPLSPSPSTSISTFTSTSVHLHLHLPASISTSTSLFVQLPGTFEGVALKCMSRVLAFVLDPCPSKFLPLELQARISALVLLYSNWKFQPLSASDGADACYFYSWLAYVICVGLRPDGFPESPEWSVTPRSKSQELLPKLVGFQAALFSIDGGLMAGVQFPHDAREALARIPRCDGAVAAASLASSLIPAGGFPTEFGGRIRNLVHALSFLQSACLGRSIVGLTQRFVHLHFHLHLHLHLHLHFHLHLHLHIHLIN